MAVKICFYGLGYELNVEDKKDNYAMELNLLWSKELLKE